MAAASHLQLTAVSFLLVLVAVVSHPAAAAAPVLPLEVRLRRAFSVALDDGGDGEEGGSGGGITECWGALTSLRSCSSEILIFLVSGESYIGPECCRAIRSATRHCWPAMLASVGFTAEEGDVLRGFCDGEAAATGAAATTPPAAGNALAPGRP